MQGKKRILWCGEFSKLNTGYSVYARELLSRLYTTDKYSICEFASYVKANDPRIYDVPWSLYANLPLNEEEEHLYKSNPINQFGEWRFNEVLVDFKPHVVISILDFWMNSFHATSPYRRLFHYLMMPTIDSEHQAEHMLAHYIDADGIFTYEEFGRKTIERETNNKVKVFDIGPMAANDKLQPVVNKKEHKQRFGLDANSIVIGTTMRNQKRKLFADLIQSFSLLLNRYPEQTKNAYLYLHTSYPDLSGWDIPRLVRESGVGNRIYFSYVCKNCGYFSPMLFSSARAFCPRCGKYSLGLCETQKGLSNEQMSAVYNLFDVYVQYSICLGKNEEILTKRGWIPISQTIVDDEVWTHKHKWQRINKTFVNENLGDVKEISIYADYEKLIITDNHPCYSISKNKYIPSRKIGIREYIGNLLRNNNSLPEPQFVNVDDLQSGDLLGVPIDDNVVDIEKIDIADFAKEKDIITNSKIDVYSGDVYNRFIEVDEEFCKFIGVYVADGSSDESGIIKVTCNDYTKLDNSKLSAKILEKLLSKPTTRQNYKDRNAHDIYGCNTLYSRVMLDWCKNHENRQLPEWCLKLPCQKQLQILIGMFRGDGCLNDYNKTDTSIYSTISKKLSEQLKVLLRRSRINFNCRINRRPKDKDKKKRKPQYCFEILGNIKNGEFVFKRRSTRNIYLGNYHFLQIKTIKESNYKNQVYNIEVENDNSYTTRIGSVHNCEGFAAPQVEAASCGVPVMAVNYSAMESVVEKLGGIPIKVQRLFCEPETGFFRAMADNEHLISELLKYIKLPEQIKLRMGRQAHLNARKHYDWDKTAATWMRYLDTVPAISRWDLPPRLHTPNMNVPPLPNPSALVQWALTNVLGEPEKADSYFAQKLTRDLNFGATIYGSGGPCSDEMSHLSEMPTYKPFGPNELLNYLAMLCERRNRYEMLRVNYDKVEKPLFIQMKKLDDKEL